MAFPRDASPGRVGVVIPGDPDALPPPPEDTRFARVFEALAARGLDAAPVVYAPGTEDAVRERLLSMDAVLVWVNPLLGDRNRGGLDSMLRDVAAHGVFVSAHPDVILKMGTKDVLVRTRHLPWGSDTHLIASFDELSAALPGLLRAGPRVLKQHRGNDGIGVWKVEALDAGTVAVQQASRDAHLERLSLDAFLDRCRPYFEGGGCVIDQPYQPRLAEGMIRCYFTHDHVVGFGHQLVTALLPPPPGTDAPPAPPPRLYHGPAKPEFQRLRILLESGWIAEMQRALDLDREALPVIWDADFLLGPRDAEGNDSYVLCEINVSSVFPIPDEAPAATADATLAAVRRVREARAAR